MVKLIGGILVAKWFAGVIAIAVTGGLIYLVVRRIAESQNVAG